MQISVDGFVGGPNGELDWMIWDWDDELKRYVTELTEPIDLIIMGRKLAEGFIPYWANAVKGNEVEDHVSAMKMNDTSKVVFSKTLKSSEWENTKLATGDLGDEINKLKKQPGHDIIVYGGGNFVTNLIKQGLIDEYHLFINPVAIGNGMTIFQGLDQKLNLKLVKATAFECGIVALFYKP